MTTTTVEDILQCEKNGSDVLRLELSRSSNCEALAEAIRTLSLLPRMLSGGVPMISRLELVTTSSSSGDTNGSDEPFWDSDAVVILFESIGRLPNLQSVTLQGRGSVNNHFPLYLLRSILVPGRNRLKYLQVNFMQLQLGSFHTTRHNNSDGLPRRSALDDSLCLQQALEQMTCLESVSFHCLAVFEDNNNINSAEVTSCFETILWNTLATKIPSLQRLVLVGKSEAQALDFFGRPMESEVPALLSSSGALEAVHLQTNNTLHLQEIRLERLDLPVEWIHRIIQVQIQSADTSSRRSSRLRVLVLGRIPPAIVIDASHDNYNDFTNSLLEDVERLLRVHPSLNTFCLHGGSGRGGGGGGYDQLLCHMAAGLAHNTGALQKVQLHSKRIRISDKVQKAFVKALEINCYIQNILLGDDDNNTVVDSIPEIAFYLKLNANMNRKHFVLNYSSVRHEEWIQILAQSYMDLDCVYYFLRLNPQLCHQFVLRYWNTNKATTPRQ